MFKALRRYWTDCQSFLWNGQLSKLIRSEVTIYTILFMVIVWICVCTCVGMCKENDVNKKKSVKCFERCRNEIEFCINSKRYGSINSIQSSPISFLFCCSSIWHHTICWIFVNSLRTHTVFFFFSLQSWICWRKKNDWCA